MSNNVVNRTLNIYIESGEAQKTLDRLIAKEKTLNDQIAQNPKNVKKLKEELALLAEPLDRARKKVSGELNPTLRETEKAVRATRLEIINSENPSKKLVETYKNGVVQLDQQRQKMGLLKSTMKSFWQEAKMVAAGVLIGNTVQSMMTAVAGYVGGIVTGSAKIADELSDIRKTTGLQKDEIRELNKELKKIDTRSSSSELRKLASEAGKLGKESVEDIRQFVDEADKIRVALGEDLGEEALIDIAKASEIFGVNMLNMASAVNEVGASSVASERYTVDFLKRMAGVAPTVKLSAQEVMGYSAALEKAGQTQEVGATALNTFMLEFVANSDKFGKAAGFASGELAKMINGKGTNAGFLTWLEKLKEANPTADQFINKLREVGIDGARGSNVFLALAENIENVREQQEIASGAIRNSNSIMDEYNEKNTNAAANLDKLKKKVHEFFASSLFQGLGEGFINWSSKFLDFLMKAPQLIKNNIQIIGLYTIAIVALNAAKVAKYLNDQKDLLIIRRLYIEEAIRNKGLALSKTLTAAWNVVTALFTFNLKKASEAMRTFNAVSKANVLGVLITLVTTAITLWEIFGSKVKKIADQKAILNEVTQKGVREAAAEITSLDNLYKKATDVKASTDARLKAVKDLQSQFPSYFGDLSAEVIMNGKAEQSYKDLRDAIVSAARARAAEKKLEERQADRLERDEKLQQQLDEAQKDVDNPKAGVYKGTGYSGYNEFSDRGARKYDKNEAKENAKRRVDNFKSQIDANKKADDEEDKYLLDYMQSQQDRSKKYEDDKAKSPNPLGSIVGDGSGVDPKKPKKNSGKSAQEREQQEMEKFAEKIKQIGRELELAAISDDERERERVIDKYEALLAEAKKFAYDSMVVEGLRDKELAQLSDKQQKAQFEQNYADALKANEKAIANRRLQAQKEFADGAIDKAGYEAKLTQIDLDGQETRYLTALSFKAFVKKADEDSVEEFRKLEENKTQIVIDEKAKRLDESKQDRLLSAALAVVKTEKGSKENLQARKNELSEIFAIETEGMDETSQMYLLKQEELNQKLADLDKEYFISKAEIALQAAQAAFDVYKMFAEARTERENQDLEDDRRRNEKKKQNLENRLKSGTVTQLEHDREVQKIEEAQERREKEVRLKQFRRNQRMQVIQTLISGAQGATSMLSAGPPAGFIMFGIAMGMAALQAAFIAKQKPPQMAKGGLLQGPSHDSPSNGLPIVNPDTGQVQAYVEGDEAILNKKAMRNRQSYTLTGTPSQIASMLNAYHGGVNWESGATIEPVWKTSHSKPINFGRIQKAYASGGIFATGGQVKTSSSSSVSGNTATNDKQEQNFKQLSEAIDNLNEELAYLRKNGIQAYTVLSQDEAARQRMKNVVDAATMK